MQPKQPSPSAKGAATMRSATADHSIIVRRATGPADWYSADKLMAEYLDWLDDSFGSAIVRTSGLGRTDRLGVEVSFAAPNQFYVASLDGDPIGCAGVRVAGPDAELTRFFVSKRARGLGVADRLVRAAINGARGGGCSHLRLQTHRPTMPVAYDVFRRLGFEERRGGGSIDGAAEMVLPLPLETNVP